MQIARYVVVALLAVACGAASGAIFIQQQMASNIAAVAAERDAIAANAAATKKAADDAKAEREQLARKNAQLEESISMLRARVDALPTEQAAAINESVDAPNIDTANPEQPTEDAAASNRGDRGGRDGDRDGGRGRGGWGDMTPEERERRGQEFRQRIDDMMAEQMQSATTPDAQQRVAAINENVQYSMDLFRQMREAQTDEERDAIRAELGEIGESTRTLVKDQQDFLLRQQMSANGVTSQASQDALLGGIRETMENPMFRMPMGGGGPGWGGGGFGGRGGGRPAPEQQGQTGQQ